MTPVRRGLVSAKSRASLGAVRQRSPQLQRLPTNLAIVTALRNGGREGMRGPRLPTVPAFAGGYGVPEVLVFMDHRQVIESTDFMLADNWYGGFYELALELGDTSNARLEVALAALWSAAGVEGCYGSRWVPPSDQNAVPCTLASLERSGHLYGVVRLPSGESIVCGVVAVREDNGADWMDFYLPLGALGRAEPRSNEHMAGDPDASSASLIWRKPIDGWLADLGTRVYAATDFRLGLIGHEVSGQTDAATIAADLPAHRRIGYLVPSGGQVQYLPAND
jgi:hypothetical protein